MPRTHRRWEPGDILSIVGRAHEGRPIYVTDEDREYFVERVKRVFVAPDVDLLAWALLINHYHLVIRVRDAVPGTLFLRLNTVIARRERRRRGDHGAVFQDRYWSRPCRDDGIVRLLTYVLGNPAHDGVVESAAALESYPWTAYPEILGLTTPGLVRADAALALVHPQPAIARAGLREAMAVRVAEWRALRPGIDRCDEPGCTGEREGCRLIHVARPRGREAATSDDPVPTPPATEGISTAHDDRRDRRARLQACGWTSADLVAPVCARFGANPDLVRSGGRAHDESHARAVLAYVVCDGVGYTVAEVATLLGVSGTAVTAARRRGRALLAANGWTVDHVLSWSANS